MPPERVQRSDVMDAISEHDSDFEKEPTRLSDKYWQRVDDAVATANLRIDDPKRYYLSSKPTIAQGTKAMIVAVFGAWEQDVTKKSSKQNAIRTVLVVKKAFFAKERKGAGWEFWAAVLNKYNEKMLKERQRKISPANFRATMHRMKERNMDALETMPIMVKARQARENLAKEIEDSYRDMRARINETGHQAKLRTDPDYKQSFEAGGEKWLVVSDEYKLKRKTAGDIEAKEEVVIDTPETTLRQKIDDLLDALEISSNTTENPFTGALRWALKKFRGSYRIEDEPKVYYGHRGYLLVESDGRRRLVQDTVINRQNLDEFEEANSSDWEWSDSDESAGENDESDDESDEEGDPKDQEDEYQGVAYDTEIEVEEEVDD